MGSSSAPKTPDYTSAAQQQGQADMSIAQYLTSANRPNQIDPYGQTTWTQSNGAGYNEAAAAVDRFGSLGLVDGTAAADMAKLVAARDALKGSQWTQTTTFSPEQQKLLEQQQNLKGLQNNRTEDLLKNFNPSQGTISDDIYKSIAGRYDERFAKDEASTRAALANQGFQVGSEGFDQGLTNFNRSKNDAYGDAATQAKISGLSQYNTEMGYLAQLLGGVQGPTSPQYQPYSQATPYQSPDLLGAMQGQYQGDLNSSNAKNAQKGQTMATVGTVAAAAAVAF